MVLKKLQARALLIQRLRQFFLGRKVLEVTTPLLDVATNTDPSIESFCFNAANRALYLQTSPEFAMKELLVNDSGDIYQVCPAFRFEEEGGWHKQEFTILEWYRVGFDHKDLMRETAELLEYVLCAEKSLGYGLSLDASLYFSYSDLFQRYLQLDPLDDDIALLHAQAEKLNCIPDSIAQDESLQRDFWLNLLFGHVIDPALGNDPELKNRAVFVDSFPASQAALARLNPQDPKVAERFEVYINGVELGNGFHELKDAVEQRERFAHEIAMRRAAAQHVPPMPERFLAALEKGLPDCAGIAVGVDRLLALAVHADGVLR